MSDYNSEFLNADSSFGLSEMQKKLLQFEQGSLREKFLKYLESAESEAEMQYFLEANPAIVPGLYDLHNGPVSNIVISKLQLSSDYVTDFAFISCNSAVAQITLVEIESPKIQVFRESDDGFTSSFNRSFQQLRDWSLWAEQNSGHMKDTFRSIYHKNVFRYQKVMVRCLLVAGRRSDIKISSKREKRWAGLNGNAIHVMTYDRLAYIEPFNPRLLNKLRCVTARQVARTIKTQGK
ncbi:MAG: DUF4263 domain-containing protein [Lysobacter sp.]|nr:MAG: DUF4263 domain-containing protein [Lysobacter sp.]